MVRNLKYTDDWLHLVQGRSILTLKNEIHYVHSRRAVVLHVRIKQPILIVQKKETSFTLVLFIVRLSGLKLLRWCSE
jgi:hypothetical protein